MIEVSLDIPYQLLVNYINFHIPNPKFLDLKIDPLSPPDETNSSYLWLSKGGKEYGKMKIINKINGETLIFCYHPKEKEIEEVKKWQLNATNIHDYIDFPTSHLFLEILTFYHQINSDFTEEKTVAWQLRDFFNEFLLKNTILFFYLRKYQVETNMFNVRSKICPDERIILDGLHTGKSDNEIALILHVQRKTISNKISILRKEFGVEVVPYRGNHFRKIIIDKDSG